MAVIKRVGKGALAGVLVAAMWYGILVARHIWLYAGHIVGDLKVSQPFMGERKIYALSVNGQEVGEISELDGWFIDRHYAYGTLQAGLAGGTAYFLFDCRTPHFEVFADLPAFDAALAPLGLAQRNFMSGENVTRMRYNQRLFSRRCEG